MSKTPSPRRSAKNSKTSAGSPSNPPAAGSPLIPSGATLPQFLSVEQVAECLGVSVKTVRRDILRGTLPARRCGRRVLVGRADFVLFASTLQPVI